jgi:hypothetical protein
LKRFPTILREMPRHFAGNAPRIDADSWGCSDTFLGFSVQCCEAFRQKPGEIAAASEKKPGKPRKTPGELPEKAEKSRGNAQSFLEICRGKAWRILAKARGILGECRVLLSEKHSGFWKNLGTLGNVSAAFFRVGRCHQAAETSALALGPKNF